MASLCSWPWKSLKCPPSKYWIYSEIKKDNQSHSNYHSSILVLSFTIVLPAWWLEITYLADPLLFFGVRRGSHEESQIIGVDSLIPINKYKGKFPTRLLVCWFYGSYIAEGDHFRGRVIYLPLLKCHQGLGSQNEPPATHLLMHTFATVWET